MLKFILLAIFIVNLSRTSNGYNLDLGSYIRHAGTPGSMFGFSIALHKHVTNWIIVGAPKTNTSYFQSNVDSGGAVFKCDIQDDNRCLMVPFDSKRNRVNDRGEQVDSKSNQWLGAAVSSGGEEGPIVACAPRYVFFTMQPKRVERIEPVGTCYTSSKDFTEFSEYSPCRTNFWGYHRQGSCQAGFSAAVSKKGDRLYIGAPGSWYWQGQVYSIHPDVKYRFKPDHGQDFGSGGQTYSIDMVNPIRNVYSTGESYSSDDDSYLGYSMITGDFNGDGEEDVAVGMPRGDRLYGKVALFKWNMGNMLNFTGRQIGAYFGYSMCSVDIDGDRRDDLVIGAPMFTEKNNENKYDVGRIYIMLQGKNGKFETQLIRDGVNSKGRFGLALTKLGDINQDGFGDFAVGAPYDGPYGRGAVYIYHGSKAGPLEKPSQVIMAEDVIGAPYPRTFGFALAGGMDLDENLYPDLAVGAYESDTVLVFKSRPVAVVDATTEFFTSSKLLSLDDKRCVLYRNGERVACTNINSCLKYNGINLPGSLDFEISWILDSKKLRTPRMFFLLDEGRNIKNITQRLERGKVSCRNETVYLVDNIRDKLTPLEVEMRYQLRGGNRKTLERRKRSILEPVIDQNREIVQRDSINIQKNCGSDNVCIPDLRLNIKTVEKFLLGSTQPLEIEVLITNYGEDAFEAGFFMIIPADLNFKKIQEIGNVRDTPITCTVVQQTTNYTLKCDIGNPLPAGKVANFKIIMMPAQKAGMAPSYEFFMEANSTNAEDVGARFDNVIKKSVNIWVKTELAIEGTSTPEFDHYKASDYKEYANAVNEADLGPQVVHIYNIRNNGPSLIEEVEVYLNWPYQTENGETLMYLLNQPETYGNIQCDPNIYVNPKNLQLMQNLSTKSYLEQSGVIVKNSDRTLDGHFVGVQIDQTGSNIGVGIGVSDHRELSEHERRRLDEDENRESTGDASLDHARRANAASVITSRSWNSSSTSGQPVVFTTSKNRTITYDGNGEAHIVESSTEYYHNINDNMSPSPSYGIYLDKDSHAGYIARPPQHSSLTTNSGGYYDNSHSSSRLNELQNSNYKDYHTPDKLARQHHSSGGTTFNTHHSSSHGNIANDARNYHQENYRASPTAGYRIEKTHSIYRHPDIQKHDSKINTDYSEYDYDDDEFREDNYENSQHHHNQEGRNHNQNYQRLKRNAINPDMQTFVPCKSAKCATLRCVVKHLENNDGAWIAIRTRLVAATMNHLTENLPLNVSTMAIAQVTRLPYIGEPKDTLTKSHELFFKAIPEPIPSSTTVPLWVVVLSACAGAIILLLLVFLLHKCGFFKRNRPRHNAHERQPLNSRNGYHGDEHL